MIKYLSNNAIRVLFVKAEFENVLTAYPFLDFMKQHKTIFHFGKKKYKAWMFIETVDTQKLLKVL